MRITVLTTGEIVFEDANVDDAVALVKQLRNGTSPALLEQFEMGSTDEYVNQPIEEDVVTLSPALAMTFEWIVSHDRGGPVTAVQVSDGLAISRENASFRLKKLLDRRVVERVGRGRYRAVK